MKTIEGSETSAFKPQTPGKYAKENILRKEHGERLKLRNALHLYTAQVTKLIKAFNLTIMILSFF
jgi:plasmid maintenance system antidote protein VapI